MQIASADKSLSKDYTLQARANGDGNFTVRHNEVVIGLDKAVKAGEMFTLPTQLHENNNFQIIWTPTNGKPVTQSMDVQLVTTITGNTLYVAPDGKAEGKGTQASPLISIRPLVCCRQAEKLSLLREAIRKRIFHSAPAA
jgi:hypothetical protein